jgi:superfamily II DNA or RNA helicase
MIEILVDNHQCRILAELKVRLALREKVKIKNRNAWYSPMYHKYDKSGNRIWDGFVRYVTEGGLFSTGLLNQVCDALDKMGKKYKLSDQREKFKGVKELKELGGLKFRPYQLESIQSVLNNTYKGVKWPRGILAEATNAGKSIISAGIFATYSSKRNGLYLVNSKTLYEQAVPDLKALLGDDVGEISSKKTNIKRINVCMVQTLGGRLKKDPKLRNFLSKVDIIIVDEADEVIGRKDCQAILQCCYNATVRLAMSGTPLKHKDPLRNQEQLKFFGPILHRISNKELVEQGVSTPPDIRMMLGNTKLIDKGEGYAYVYKKGIMTNKKRHKRIWKLVEKFSEKNRGPFLILFKEHKHGYSLKECMPESLSHLKVDLVHHETKGREAIFKRFNEGKIDVLIASMIIKRGKNLPLIKTLINAAGGTSETNLLQILGRALRSHKSKKKVYVIDYWDLGPYLNLHSKRRLRYYLKEKFEVRESYKKQLAKANY